MTKMKEALHTSATALIIKGKPHLACEMSEAGLRGTQTGCARAQSCRNVFCPPHTKHDHDTQVKISKTLNQ
jgi:hypothetical protein